MKSSTPPQYLNDEAHKDDKGFKAFLAKYDTLLLDCDGVLWSGTNLIPNIKETLEKLRSSGKRLIFVTNNSTNSRTQYQKKFEKLGLQASKEEIFGSSYAAAVFIKNVLKFPEDKVVYVIGMKGIQEELENMGIKWIGGEDEDHSLKAMNEMESIQPDSNVGAVLCGFDINISYTKLAKAYTFVSSNPDCHFLATNDDTTFPAGGKLYPGTGSLVAALATALDKKPRVLGKPHQTMLDVIVENYHLDRSRTCMVGDRLDTDIAFGKTGGVSTLLVGTGVTKLDTLESDSSILPDYVINSFGDLAEHI